MTADTIHTCSYECERPGCIRAQRDELAARLTTPPSAPEPEVHSYDPTDQRESVTIRWPDGKCLSYVLDRTRYTDNLPPSATTGVDFAAVASILRRAMRDGMHYGYRRDFILQQALALEALSQQPAAVGMTKLELFTIAAMHTLRAGDYAKWEHLAQDAVSLADATIAALAQQPAAVDEAKETDLWRCTVCGRVGTVGRCCGEETRERANMESLQEVDMAITGGFGTTLDMERGTSRKWVMGSDGVKRWADSGLPCEPPSCDECEYCFPDEVRDGDDYVWKHYCNLAEPGGRAIEIDEGECCPDWCPLAMLDEHNGARND